MSDKIRIWPGMPVEVPSDNYAKAEDGTPLQEGLTSVTNKDNAKDMYGNSLLTKGDEADQYATESVLDPNRLENPEAGSFAEAGPKFCKDCGIIVTADELAKPAHLGHNIEYGDGKTNYDVGHIARRGGDYEVGWKVEPSEQSYAIKPLESVPTMVSAAEATPNYLAEEKDQTEAM